MSSKESSRPARSARLAKASCALLIAALLLVLRPLRAGGNAGRLAWRNAA